MYGHICAGGKVRPPRCEPSINVVKVSGGKTTKFKMLED